MIYHGLNAFSKCSRMSIENASESMLSRANHILNGGEFCGADKKIGFFGLGFASKKDAGVKRAFVCDVFSKAYELEEEDFFDCDGELQQKTVATECERFATIGGEVNNMDASSFAEIKVDELDNNELINEKRGALTEADIYCNKQYCECFCENATPSHIWLKTGASVRVKFLAHLLAQKTGLIIVTVNSNDFIS